MIQESKLTIEIMTWLIFSIIVSIGLIVFVIWYLWDTRNDRGCIAEYVDLIFAYSAGIPVSNTENASDLPKPGITIDELVKQETE